MKITQSQLRQIIKEELSRVLKENSPEEPSAVETMNGQYVGKSKEEIEKALEMYEKRIRTQRWGDPNYDQGAQALHGLLQDYLNKGTFKGAKRYGVPSSQSDWDSI